MFRLPTGSFTVDKSGRVVASTLPQSFPAEKVHQIGQVVLQTLQTAQEAKLPFSELVIEYAALKLTAKELRGGAIIFLAPRNLTGK